MLIPTSVTLAYQAPNAAPSSPWTTFAAMSGGYLPSPVTALRAGCFGQGVNAQFNKVSPACGVRPPMGVALPNSESRLRFLVDFGAPVRLGRMLLSTQGMDGEVSSLAAILLLCSPLCAYDTCS